MATRQYIGARYVPKFYQNSVDGSASWENNVVYEPLTWVTMTNGHLYLSRKQVPATVGTPAQNIDYWLDVGSYNGYIEGLQEQIDAINNTTIPAITADIDDINNTKIPAITSDIDDINNTKIPAITSDIDTINNTTIPNVDSKIGTLSNLKTPVKSNIVNAINSMFTKSVICVTDSYGMYPSASDNWMTKVKTFLGLDSAHFRSRAYSGAGFSTGGETFKQQLEQIASGMTSDEKAAVTDVVIGGGFNDAQNNNPNMLVTDATTCINYIHSTFPNAKAHIAFIGWSFNSEWVSKIRQYNCLDTYQTLVHVGYNYVRGSENCLRGKAAFTEESQGNTSLYLGHFYGHPSNAGAYNIAICVANHLRGSAGFKRHDPDYYLVSPTLASGLTLQSGSLAFYMQQQEDIISVIKDDAMNATVISFSSNRDFSTGITIEIGLLKDGFIAGIDSSQSGGRPLTQMSFDGLAWQNGWKKVNGVLLFMNNRIYLRVHEPAVTSAESIAICGASGTFPTIAC